MARRDLVKSLVEENAFPEVNFSDFGDVRYLHLGTPWVQGSMLMDAPYDIELEYVQRMMAGLLFMAPSTMPKKHAMQLGLGSAALTKFCYKKLRMRATAVEINPQVITACRVWFKLPRDDLRLQVIAADALAEIQNRSTGGQWTCCMSICTTRMQLRRCSTAPTFTCTAMTY